VNPKLTIKFDVMKVDDSVGFYGKDVVKKVVNGIENFYVLSE
jgi:hypothetical protein